MNIFLLYLLYIYACILRFGKRRLPLEMTLNNDITVKSLSVFSFLTLLFSLVSMVNPKMCTNLIWVKIL